MTTTTVAERTFLLHYVTDVHKDGLTTVTVDSVDALQQRVNNPVDGRWRLVCWQDAATYPPGVPPAAPVDPPRNPAGGDPLGWEPPPTVGP